MMYKSFREFEKAYSVPYSEKRYDEVMDLLNHSSEYLTKEEYEENKFIILLDMARIYSELLNEEECLKIIKTIVDKGYAFPLNWTRFDFLKEHQDYEALITANEELYDQARANASFKYKVHLPKSYNPEKKYPLFFSLHGDGSDGNIPNHSWYWTPDSLLEKGYIVVYPQSSQVRCHNGFGWLLDPLKAQKELKCCYEKLITEYSIDENHVIIGGFSGGATTSIDIAMSDSIPVKGFVALCPGGEKIMSFDKSSAEQGAIRGIKGVIFEGEFETEAEVQEMLRVFKEVGFSCEYHINSNIGHWYPEGLGEKLISAVDFIAGK